MIHLILDNEILDIEPGSVVTFKKAQQLNGVQNQYSFSNNFNLSDSAKNRRKLQINYLPTSKAKSMTEGFEIDVVFDGCIFLKRQRLKVQKDGEGVFPSYVIFTDNLFMANAKNLTMNEMCSGIDFTKNLGNFITWNGPLIDDFIRTAPISAQETSGLIVVEEVPILLNLRKLVYKAFDKLGYSYTGDILTDELIGRYWTSSSVGVYGPDGVPHFDKAFSVYDFITWFLKTFNGYIEVSDSSKMVGLYFWKNIETIKSQFVDYTDKFVKAVPYTSEGGLAKTNELKYSDSPDYFNGFFNNNKSLVDKKEYLVSDFGAGPLQLFADQDVNDDGTIDLRVIGEETEAKTMNLFIFDSYVSPVKVYSGGVATDLTLFKAVSPNILQIWQDFHRPYTNNIAVPTMVDIIFRYDAIFISNFKMSEVFFIKNLSTYWLPMELNFTSKKDQVKVKSLMIEKTAVDAPIVFDYSMQIGFYGEGIINNINILYSALNVSPADIMTIVNADLTKNRIFINETEILALPTSVSVADAFAMRIVNNETENVISNSDILFQFISVDGGLSRVAKLNIAHNGRANFISEFKSEPGSVYFYERHGVDYFYRKLNYSAKITSPINIADTLATAIGDVETDAEAQLAFKFLQFDRSSNVKVDLSIEFLELYCSNEGGGAEARTKIYFDIYKNGVKILNIYSAGVIDSYKKSDTTVAYANISVTKSFSVAATDVIQAYASLEGTEESRPGSGHMGGHVKLKNVNWKFQVTEQL